MSMQSPSREYACALFALSGDACASVIDELSRAHELIDRHADLALFLANPTAPSGERVRVLERIMGAVHPLTAYTCSRLMRTRALSELPRIILLFSAMHRAAVNRMAATVQSAVSFTESQRRALIGALERFAGCPVDPVFETDAELIAGCRIRIGNYTIDNSVKKEIEDFSRYMRTAIYQ